MSNDSDECFHQVSCPHCNGTVLIHRNEVNCRIFRHGVFHATGQPIPPHAPREECDRFVEQGVIYGCGKPFRLIENNLGSTEPRVVESQQTPSLIAVICDYI